MCSYMAALAPAASPAQIASRIRRCSSMVSAIRAADGVVGSQLDGRWYGGHYGCSWPHGMYSIAQATLIGAMTALVSSIDPAGTTVTLVNLSAAGTRTVVEQAGSYAEHASRPRGTPGPHPGGPGSTPSTSAMMWR